jgi:hypothetical protein
MPPIKARSSHEAPAPNGQTAEDRALIEPTSTKPPESPGGGNRSKSMMPNRHERRALASIFVFPKITKVHEAGHALGRVLTEGDLSGGEYPVIDYIDFEVIKRKGEIEARATVYGPLFSVEMEKRIPVDKKTSVSVESIRRACEGMDLSRWMRAKLFIIAMGPAAEARFSGKPIADVLQTPDCEGDLKDMVWTCAAAGIEDDDESNHQFQMACVRAEHVVRQDAAWAAINRLAEAFPARGRFDGKRAVEILSVAFRELQATGIKVPMGDPTLF